MTSAARRLGMTQSSVSQIVGNLEQAAGTALFDRSIRPLALTAAGSSLYERGRAVLATANEALQAVRQQGSPHLSSLTLAMAESVANTVGPLLVRELQALAERWRIWSGISPDHHAALMSHAVDAIVTTSDELDAAPDLEHHDILTESFVLAFPAGYEGPCDALERLGEMPFIRYSLRSAIGRQIEQQINRLRLGFPIHAEFDTATGQLVAVAEGMGWSMTTPLCLLQELDKLSGLRIEPLRRNRFSRRIKLVARKGDLGAAPAVIAETAGRLLRERCLPRLYDRLPWIERELLWPEAAAVAD